MFLPRRDRMLRLSTSAGRSAESAVSIPSAWPTASGVRFWPARMSSNSSSNNRTAMALSAGAPVMVISLPRTWMSLSSFVSITRSNSSREPSKATIACSPGTTRVVETRSDREVGSDKFGFLLGPGVDPAHSTFLTPEDPGGAYDGLPEAYRRRALQKGELTVGDPPFGADDDDKFAARRWGEIAEPVRRLFVQHQGAGGADEPRCDAFGISGLADRRHPRAPALLRCFARCPAPPRHCPVPPRAGPDCHTPRCPPGHDLVHAELGQQLDGELTAVALG